MERVVKVCKFWYWCNSKESAFRVVHWVKHDILQWFGHKRMNDDDFIKSV